MDSATQRRKVSDYPNLDALSLFQDSHRCRSNVECIAPYSFESRTNGPQNPKEIRIYTCYMRVIFKIVEGQEPLGIYLQGII